MIIFYFYAKLIGEKGLEDASANFKFIANIIKHKSDIYRYFNKIEVILDSYSSKIRWRYII